MKISKYSQLGLLVVISLSILIWGINYLQGNDIFKHNDYYHVIYDNVGGLSESNEVILNGYRVGHVKEIRFTDDNSGKLLVTLLIDASLKIPLNSSANIVSSGIMGTRSIKLVISDEKEYYMSNDTVPGTLEGDLFEQLMPIKDKVEQSLVAVDSAIAILTATLNEDVRTNISGTIENLNKISASLNEIVSYNKENIQHVISNADNLAATLGNNTEDLEKTIKNLSAFSDTLSQLSVTPLLNNLTGASNQILSTIEKINSGNSSAGLLLNDDKLYFSLNDMSQNLGSLIKNIETNPKRYLSFSAFDFSKEVNITTGGELVSDKIKFKVNLISTQNPMPLNSPLFEGLDKVEEYLSGDTYNYCVGNSSSYNEILKLYNQVKEVYPDARIVALKNGRLIKLKKAIKLTR